MAVAKPDSSLLRQKSKAWAPRAVIGTGCAGVDRTRMPRLARSGVGRLCQALPQPGQYTAVPLRPDLRPQIAASGQAGDQ